MGNVNSTVDAIQYEEVAFNSQEDYEQDTGSYSTFYYIESEQLLASITNYNKEFSVWEFNEDTVNPYDKNSATIRNIKNIKLNSSAIDAMRNYLASKQLTDKYLDIAASYFADEDVNASEENAEDNIEKDGDDETVKDEVVEASAI